MVTRTSKEARQSPVGFDDIIGLARIQVALIVPFVICKLARPGVLASDAPQAIKAFFLSAPNLFEGVTGTLVLTAVGLLVSAKSRNHTRWSPRWIYAAAVSLAAIFVTAQELNILDLRGDNTYDPIDLIYSAFGLAVGYGLVLLKQPNVGARR